KITDGEYNVLTQDQMNEALKQYGYPANAILSPSLASTLAKSVQARVLVASSMSKAGGSQYGVPASLAGVNGEAGCVVSVQQSGVGLSDLGNEVADQLQAAYKSMPDAKSCVDQKSAKPDKAEEPAGKALKQYPGNGLAEFCLAQLGLAKKDTKAAIQHFQAAAKNDPLSINA